MLRRWRKRIKLGVIGRIISAALLIVLITLIAFIYFAGGEVSLTGARRAFSGLGGVKYAEEMYFEQGFDGVFAAIGDNVVAAGSIGLTVRAPSGEELHRDTLRLDNPAIASRGNLAAVYDVGGRAVRLVGAGGALARIEAVGDIISCSVGAGGYVALSTREDGGFKTSVTVYGGRGYGELYKWFSGEAYILSAAVAPDNRTLAVLTLGSGGSAVRFFAFNSVDEQRRLDFADELLLELAYGDDSRLIAVGQGRVCAIPKSGGMEVIYDYAGATLRDFSLGGDGFLTLCLVGGVGAGTERLVTVDHYGGVLGEIAAPGELIWLDAYGDRVGALWDGRLSGYDRRLDERAFNEDTSGLITILVRRGGAALATRAHSAELFDIS
jgi:hypothetical protein